MKHLIIEQLKEGFILIDEINERSAISSSMFVTRIKAYFGLTDHTKPKKDKTKNNIAPPAKVKDACQCTETQEGIKPGSIPGRATLQSLSTEHKGGNPVSGGINKDSELKKNKIAYDVMNESILSESKLGTPDTILHPSDLKIAKFDYRGWSPKKYKSLSIWELPDGSVVLEYNNSHYYTSKEAVMQIPYPFPKGYFSKAGGWSSSVKMAFKSYRRHLAEQHQQDKEQQKQQQVEKQKEKQAEEDTDDWKFKPMLKKDTKGNHGEDYEKIEGALGY